MGTAAGELAPRGHIGGPQAEECANQVRLENKTTQEDDRFVAAGELSEEEDEEPEPSQDAARSSHCWSIATGAVVSTVAYGALYAATGDSTTTEDMVDLAHSAYTSSVALSGIASLERHGAHAVALPRHAAGESGAVVRMFCHSIGYFFADVLLISSSLLTGQRPNLWEGRLAHHAIQACANLPPIFQTRSKKESLALRSVLCIAYFAEFSNLFLRLSNMMRRNMASARALKAMNVGLVLSFAASRMINFPFAIFVFLKARPLVSPNIFRLILSIQASGYALNLLWFVKIIKILMKPDGGVPSIEC